MDIKLLKYMSRIFGILTLIVAVAVPFFPDLRQQDLLAREQKEQQQQEFAAQLEAYQESLAGSSTEMGDEESAVRIEGVIHEENEEEIGAQLKIELPQEAGGVVDIWNDCINQTVHITFPCESTDYFSQYHVQGKSDGIEALSYYYQDGEGTLELATNQIYGVENQMVDGYLYLNLENPHEIYDQIVVIDAGHGGQKPGAVQGTVMEKDIDLAIVKEVKKLFDNSSERIGVFYTRLNDSDPTLEQRVGLANLLEADLFISIHNNSSGKNQNPNITGTQVLYRKADTSKYSSKKFAQICLDQMVNALESEDLGLVKGDDIFIIKHSKMPVALIEVGFMTNPQELARLNTQVYQAQAAKGVYNAVLQSFKDGF